MMSNGKRSTSDERWFNFEKLEIYQKATDLAVEIYDLTKKFPKEELYGIVNQIRRAVISVSINIAEGTGCSKIEFRRYLRVARSSLYEVVCLLEISLKVNYISKDGYNIYYNKCMSLSQMVSALIKSLDEKR